MIAALPMYAFPRTAAADARFWSAIADALRALGLQPPDRLTLAPTDLMAHWTDPELLLSQTCGRPYKDHLRGKVYLVGTPDYGVKGCPAGHYRSLVVARNDDRRERLDDFAGARFAYNEAGSQSGWAALAAEAPDVLRGPKLATGSHRNSTLAVRGGRADFASIDAVTLRHLTSASEATGLKIVHGTEPRPGLPFITSTRNDPDQLFNAVASALASLSAADRDVLGINGIVRIPAEAYLALPDPKVSAA